MGKNILLCGDIFLHPLMIIEVIRRNIGNYRDIRRKSHCMQLKARQLHDRIVVFGHISELGKQRSSDISADKDTVSRSLENF